METVKSKRKTTEQEKQVFKYLNSLRKSEVTNMFGAAPYIEGMFGTNRYESGKLLRTWMKSFNNEGNYDEIDCED